MSRNQRAAAPSYTPIPTSMPPMRSIPHPPPSQEHGPYPCPPTSVHNGSSPLPSRVTIEELIIVLHGNSNRKSASHGFLAGIFSTLNRFGVVVDLIRTSEVCVSMAIERARARKVPGRPVNDRRENGCGTARREMGIRSLVGARMRGMVGIAIRGGGRSAPSHSMMGNVNVEMISQGASETRIPCVIGARDAVEALTVIDHPSEPLADRA